MAAPHHCDAIALTHKRPSFGIASGLVGEREVAVVEEHVPYLAGRFGLNESTAHIIDFLGVLGPGAALMVICPPCVAALSAIAIMSEDGHPATPARLILMAGPIDCRISPTAVNNLATAKPIEWFAQNLISAVPLRYAGGTRRVYPGFLQLTAFLRMNLERHNSAFRGPYEDGSIMRSKSCRRYARSTKSTSRYPTCRRSSISKPCGTCFRNTRCLGADCNGAGES